MRTRDRYDDDVVLKASGAETTSTTGSTKTFYSLPEQAVCKMLVSAVSGTDPTLTIELEGSDNDSNWFSILTAPTANQAGKYELPIGPQDFKYYRYKSTITGSDSPSFTYSLILSC